MRTNPGITRKLGVVAIAAAMLTLAGCGGGQDANAGDDAASPLKKYLGYSPFESGGGQGPMMMSVQAGAGSTLAMPGMPAGNQDAEEQAAQNRKVENLIATCMEEQGFEYVPYVPDESEEQAPWEKAYDLPPEKFAERWGYGIATMGDIFAVPEQDENPNDAIRNKLSESAQKAYDEALYGEGGGMAETFETGPQKVERGRPAGEPGEPGEEGPSGCSQQATEEVFGDLDANIEELSGFQSLFEDVHALTERLDRDPDVVEANRAWSDCMTEAGHAGFDSPRDARSSIEQELAKAYDQGGPGDFGGEGGSNGMDGMGGGEPDLDKLADKEIELATADFECAEQGLNDVRAEAAERLEAEFVEDNKAELERYRDYRTEQQGGSSDDQESGN